MREELKPALFVELMRRGDIGNVIVFTRTKHRSNRLAEYLNEPGVSNARIHGNRSQAQRTEALEGFKSGRYRCLVATDIVARGIDVEQLEHVVNFDVPHLPEDYIHRVGRTARADATGDAFTLRVAGGGAGPVRRSNGRSASGCPGWSCPGSTTRANRQQRFEVPIAERIAEIRARKAEERRRAKEKAERRAANAAGGGGAPAAKSAAAASDRPSRGHARSDSTEAKGEGGGTRHRRRRGGHPKGGQGGSGAHPRRSDGPYR